MLSAVQMVKVQRAIESMYDSMCTVKIKQEYEKPNGETGFRDVTVLENEPCHLKYMNAGPADSGDASASISQQIKLFLSPDKEILAGSKITVFSAGFERSYKFSGVSRGYETHQEIELELDDRWP